MLPQGAFWLASLLMPSIWAQSPESVSSESTRPDIYPPVTVTAPALSYRQFDRVEITGSSIIRKEQTLALPVQIVTRADIQKSGKQTIADYLQSLPVMFNSFSPAMLGAIKSGYSGAAIHGLQTGTLVLVNGRRLANYGLQTSSGTDNGGVDLNNLPLSAIERVEILTDGASSVYGTDSQTGVINIITRKERPGLEITVDHRMPDGYKGVGSRVDLAYGKGQLDKDGYSWFVAADLLQQEELLGRDRPYAAAGFYTLQQNGQEYWAYGSRLTPAQTSTTLASSKSASYMSSADSGVRLWNAGYQNGQCPNGQVPARGQTVCLDNSYQDKGLYPAQNAARLHALGQWQIRPDITAYTELSWQQSEQRRTYNGWGQYSAKIGTTPGSPGYELAVANGFDPSKGTWLLYSGSALGPTSRWYTLETRRLVAGVKGQWQDWNFNTGYYFSDNQASYERDVFKAYPNLGVDSQGVLTNPALLSPLSGNDAGVVLLRQQLQAMVLPRLLAEEGSNRIQGLDLKASRSIGEIDGRDVLLALGTDWHHENAQFASTTYGARIPAYAGQRTVWAQFAEIQLPLPRAIEMLASLRNDRYSDFGNTTHAKLAAKWAPDPKWLVRGAWGTGFRAPAVAQMQETGKVLTSSFQYSCTTEMQAIASRLGGSCATSNVYNVFSQGSSRLRPELSTQWNLGMRFSPDRNHTLSLDYWRVDMRDKINTLNPGMVLSNPQRYSANFELNAQGELQIFSPMINVGRTSTSGIDFSWDFRRPTDWGQLLLGATGTWLLTSRYQLADGEPFVSDLNSYSDYQGFVVPKLRTRWHAGLNRTAWQSLLVLNHIGSHGGGSVNVTQPVTGEVLTLPSHRVPAWWTVDAVFIYQWKARTRLRFGIDNLLNRKAPLDFAYTSSFNFGTNPTMANVWGRTAHLSLTHRF